MPTREIPPRAKEALHDVQSKLTELAVDMQIAVAMTPTGEVRNEITILNMLLMDANIKLKELLA